MNSNLIAAIVSSALVVLGGCAGSETVSSVEVTPPSASSVASSGGNSSAPGVSATSAALAMVSDAVACMLGEARDAERCAQLAGAAGVTPASLARAEIGATEQLTELVARTARREQVPSIVRTPLVRWLDLAAGAAREARAAREGAAGARLEAVTRAAEGHPELEVMEEARRIDAGHARGRAHLAALFASVADADVLAPEVEATALLVLAQRIDIAAHARAETREDAAAALSDLVTGLRNDGALGGRAAAPQARASAASEGTGALVEARALVSERLATLAPRVTARTTRALAESAAERTQVARR